MAIDRNSLDQQRHNRKKQAHRFHNPEVFVLSGHNTPFLSTSSFAIFRMSLYTESIPANTLSTWRGALGIISARADFELEMNFGTIPRSFG
jgi:hypothetical protein